MYNMRKRFKGKKFKGQISTELIVIVGIVLLLFIPVLVTVYFKGVEIGDRLAVAQSRLVVTRISSLANAIGNLGENASAVIDVFVPSNMKSISFVNSVDGTGSEVIIKLSTPEGENEISEPIKFKFASGTQVNYTTSSKGWIRFNISSRGEELEISKVG